MDLTYNTNLNTANRTISKLELALDPTAAPLIYVTVPSLSGLDGWKPNVTVTRIPLYNNGGAAQDAVSTRVANGPQNFSTVAPPKNATIQAMITKAQNLAAGASNAQVMARYTDGNGMIWQGQAVLVYRGEQGTGVADNIMYDFGIEWVAAAPTFPA